MVAPEMALPRLIGIDWGSTGLRVFLVDAYGRPLISRSAPQGSATLNNPTAYRAALETLAGDWLRVWSDLPLLACGMVGSQHGWCEVPYVTAAAGVDALAAGAHQVSLYPGRPLWIVPGMRCQPAGEPADVMRGEETQIIGALATQPALQRRACLILPGTHSKWARVSDGAVQQFATHMTGELYALLRSQSVLGRLMTQATQGMDQLAFAAGVDAARLHAARGLTHQLFSVRTLGLMGEIAPSGLADYLSGLLIGHELHTGLAWRAGCALSDAPLVLAGDAALCQRYDMALRQFGVSATVLPNTAPAGLLRIAQAMRLTPADHPILEAHS